MGCKLNKKVYIPIILLIIVGIIIGSLTFSFAENRSYSIPFANIDLTVEDDGSLHVKETIHYHFVGIYNGIYRDIPLKSYENMENIHINVSGAYYKYEVNNLYNKRQIKVFLYSDPAMTIPISNKDIDVTYEYDFLHVVKFYNDLAELQYKLWGEDWDVPVGQVNAVIHVKSRDGIEYWLNPLYLAENTSWNDSNFIVTSKSIPKNNWFEIRMAIPLNQFTSYIQGQYMGGYELESIKDVQQNYSNWIHFQEILYLILPIIIILSMIYPFFMFHQFWEGRIRFNDEYDGKLPENEPPALVNAIYGSGISKKVGEPDINGFIATIMDLIKRRYILVEYFSKREDDNLVLKINHRKPIEHLKAFEKDIINFFKEYEKDHVIHLSEMNENLNKGHFQKRYFHWRKNVIKKLSHGKLESVFIKKNNTGIFIYGIFALLGSLLIIALTFNNPMPNSNYSFYTGILLLTMSILSLIAGYRAKGQWTDYGLEYRSKWMRFKKYIRKSGSLHENINSNYSFDNYLIYGTALGVGNDVFKSLRKEIPMKELIKSHIFLLHNSSDYRYLRTTMISSMGAYGAIQAYSSSYSGGGGFGGFGGGGSGGAGGGSGGGGGGAF